MLFVFTSIEQQFSPQKDIEKKKYIGVFLCQIHDHPILCL